MDTLSKEAYNFTHEHLGLKEVEGPENTSMIVLAHHICGLSSLDTKEDVDSKIPWCSSWVNLAIVAACIRRNPYQAKKMLEDKGLNLVAIRRCFEYAKTAFIFSEVDTGLPIAPPTWSAASRSWDNWGYEVPIKEARRGDLVRLVRDGGGHICFLDEDSPGLAMLKVLGGNQSNMICSSNSYARSRVVTVRRSFL